MSEELDKKKRVIGLRIAEKTMEEVKQKAGETSLEYQFLLTLKEANVPYSILANMLGVEQSYIRECVTYRRRYDSDEERERVCMKFRKVLINAMDNGLLPCTDVAVVEPILRLTLRVMALGQR